MAVIGTLLALLVFFALFGVFLTQYLPLWMNENEVAFTNSAESSFAYLKSNVDLQTALQSPPVFQTPFTMNSQGVPLIAQPTVGVLSFIPFTPGVFANISMNPGPGNSHLFWQNVTLGTVSMYLPNRYFSPQTFSYEDDAVVQAQTDTSQILAFPPTMTVNQTGNQISVTMSLVQLLGNASQVITTGTQQVASHFVFSQTYASNGTGLPGTLNATFAIGTHFPCAWASYLAQILSQAKIAASHYTLTPNTCVASGGNVVKIALSLKSITTFTLVFAELNLVTGVGVS
ncbi:MAG TPA: hypothetical protein VJQ43_01335 [Thermoplasmata archaeon]|nr:hypothetical protein [Thermoplasmata archaeon]